MPQTIDIVTFDGGGNLPPLAGIAGELVRRGHQVRVISTSLVPGDSPTERVRGAFEPAGCEIVALQGSPDAGPAPDAASVVARIPREFAVVQGYALFASFAPLWAMALEPHMRRQTPDIVLVDVCLPGAAYVAAALGVPYAVLHHTILDPAFIPGTDAPDRAEFSVYANVALPYLNDARGRLGLPVTDDALEWQSAAARTLVLTSPAFDDAPKALPPGWQYTGAVQPSVSAPEEWSSPWAADDPQPLIVASSTTTGYAAIWKPAMLSIVEACAELPVRLLLTIGSHVDASDFPSHHNVCIRDRVPHEAVLPAAALIISQCGHATTMAALRHGVPMVCIPGFADQPAVAALIVRHGAGVRLHPRPSPEDVRQAVTTVLQEASYRDAARRLRAIIAREDGAAVAADEVELVLEEARSSASV